MRFWDDDPTYRNRSMKMEAPSLAAVAALEASIQPGLLLSCFFRLDVLQIDWTFAIVQTEYPIKYCSSSRFKARERMLVTPARLTSEGCQAENPV